MSKASSAYTRSGSMRMPGNMTGMRKNDYMQVMRMIRNAREEVKGRNAAYKSRQAKGPAG